MTQKIKTAKIVPFQYPRWPHGGHLKILLKSLDGRHPGEMEIQNCSSSIQDDGHGSKLETLQTTSDSELLKSI